MIFSLLATGNTDGTLEEINHAFDRACSRRLKSFKVYQSARKVAKLFGDAFPAGLPNIPWADAESYSVKATYEGVTLLRVSNDIIVMIGIHDEDGTMEVWIYRRPVTKQARKRGLHRPICHLSIEGDARWRIHTASELVVTRALELPTIITDSDVDENDEAPTTTVDAIQNLVEALKRIAS